MSGQQRPEAGMPGRHHHQRPVVGDLRHVQPAVFRRDLHPETTQFGEALDIFVGDLRVALDDAAVDRVEEFPQLGQELLGASGLFIRGPGKWVNELKRKSAEEKLLGQGRFIPTTFARFLSYGSRLLFADLCMLCHRTSLTRSDSCGASVPVSPAGLCCTRVYATTAQPATPAFGG